ncbi:MAG: hypothetical protein WC981_02885, partial [Candidatus Dojkabacteria bacterium]
MAYEYKSSKYLLPVNTGDAWDFSEDERRVDIIDHALYRIVNSLTPFFNGSGVITEGNYSLVANTVTLSPDGDTPAIYAFINSIPIYIDEVVTWTGVTGSSYLYLQLIESYDESSRQFGHATTLVSSMEMNNPNCILLAVVNGSEIDSNFEGKLRVLNIGAYDTNFNGIIDNSERLDGLTLQEIIDLLLTYLPDMPDIPDFSDIFNNFYISGDTPELSDTLSHTIPSQELIVAGKKVTTIAEILAYNANRDTYLDVGIDSIINQIEVSPNSIPVVPEPNRFRIFKVETRSSQSATGSIIINRRPLIGDKVIIDGVEFVATNSVTPVDTEFYRGATDDGSGWDTCALSLSNAINSSSADVVSSVSSNTIDIAYSNTGSEGNILIELYDSGGNSVGNRITATGLSGGHNGGIVKIIDYRGGSTSTLKEAVDKVTDLPDTAQQDELRLVRDVNKLYRYYFGKWVPVGGITVGGTTGVEENLDDITFVTAQDHPSLPQAISLEKNSVIHSSINHDAVPITDPGGIYPQGNVYAVLGDHIADAIAHGGDSESVVWDLHYWWKILPGEGNQKFRIHSTKDKYFDEEGETLLFDYNSDSISNTDGVFLFQQGDTSWELAYTASSTIYEAIYFNDEIHFLGLSFSYTSNVDGVSWEPMLISPVATPLCVIDYDDTIWVGTASNVIYKLVDGVWVDTLNTAGTDTYSFAIHNDMLFIGTDGEISTYSELSGLSQYPVIDVPVEQVNAMASYGGLLYFSTKGPDRLYVWDGDDIVLEDVSFTDSVRDIKEFAGRLYLSTSAGEIYEKDGISGSWVLIFSAIGLPTRFVVTDGILYIAIGSTVYKKVGTNTFELFSVAPFVVTSLLCTPDNIYISSGNV